MPPRRRRLPTGPPGLSSPSRLAFGPPEVANPMRPGRPPLGDRRRPPRAGEMGVSGQVDSGVEGGESGCRRAMPKPPAPPSSEIATRPNRRPWIRGGHVASPEFRSLTGGVSHDVRTDRHLAGRSRALVKDLLDWGEGPGAGRSMGRPRACRPAGLTPTSRSRVLPRRPLPRRPYLRRPIRPATALGRAPASPRETRAEQGHQNPYVPPGAGQQR